MKEIVKLIIILLAGTFVLPQWLCAENSSERGLVLKRTENMPLYLSLMEFARPKPEEILEALQQMQEKSIVEPKGELKLKPFHQRSDEKLKTKMEPAEQSFCRSCHLSLPHQENIRSRTFNNMHSRFLACESCHIKEAIWVEKRLELNWFDLQKRSILSAPESPFHIDQSLAAGLVTSSIRISPFYQQRPAIISRQHLYVERLMEDWELADETQRATLKARVHQPLRKQGAVCKDCHSPNGLLDLGALGADEKRQSSFENNSIAVFFRRYGVGAKTTNGSRKTEDTDVLERIRIIELLP